MRKLILIAMSTLALVILVILILAARQPSQFQVARSINVNTSPERVFPHVNTLRKWAAWNPWEKIDPQMKLTYEGPESGVGAAYAWAGNSEVGEGRMTITGSVPPESVRFRLEFYKPMAGTSDAEFSFKPQGKETMVTWAMTGRNNFVGKVMCLFMSMDQMIGSQFEKGLAELKAIAEAEQKLTAAQPAAPAAGSP